jgi:hypothetical protein
MLLAVVVACRPGPDTGTWFFDPADVGGGGKPGKDSLVETDLAQGDAKTGDSEGEDGIGPVDVVQQDTDRPDRSDVVGQDGTTEDPEIVPDVPGKPDVAPDVPVPLDVVPDVPVCVPVCAGKVCGDDGCGSTCGDCDADKVCLSGACFLDCGSNQCAMGVACAVQGTYRAVCGGTVNFDQGLAGNNLPVGHDVASEYALAGVLFSTPTAGSSVRTNAYALQGADSKKNSCATVTAGGEPWLNPIDIRFVVPSGVMLQGSTYEFSVFIGLTWSDGIAVDFYAPNSPPWAEGSQRFHRELTHVPGWGNPSGTAKVTYQSTQPIGFVRIRPNEDENFTIDDLSFGPVVVYSPSGGDQP